MKRGLTLLLLALGLCAVQAQEYSYLPSSRIDDGRMFIMGSRATSDIGNETLEFRMEISYSWSELRLGVFDGDISPYVGAVTGHWDVRYPDEPVPKTLYTVFADPDGDEHTMKFVKQWNSDMMVDNDWFDCVAPQSPHARCKNGNYVYRLQVSCENPHYPEAYADQFKIRVNGKLEIRPTIFSACAPLYSWNDVKILFPRATDFSHMGPSNYNGQWKWFFYLPKPVTYIEFWDGDFDRGNVISRSGDTDDPDTPNDVMPPWALSGDETQLEGAKGNGNPPDDSPQKIYRISPAVRYALIAPDGQIFTNPNPSGNSEWERFRVDTAPFDRSKMDYHADVLPAGVYTVHVTGTDYQNSNIFRFFTNIAGTGTDGTPVISVPIPESHFCSLGDYVWYDRDQDGQPDQDEPPLGNVTLWLINEMGYPINKVRSDAKGYYLFSHIPAGTYTVAVDYSTLPPGFVGTTEPSPYQVTINKEDNFRDADFGFATGYGNGRCHEVFAWYEPWFASASSDSALRHWDHDKRGGISDSARFDLYHQPSPVENLFDSQDQHIWEHDILLAWAADIDAFVVNWHGRNAFEQAATRGLLETAQHLWEKYADQGFDFRIIIAYDEQALGNLDDNLRFIADSLLVHPAYYHGREGLAAGSWEQFPRPLFVFCPDQSLDPAGFRNSADTNLPDDVQIVWNWDGEYTELKDHVDSVYPWVMASNGHWDDLNGLEWGEGYLDTFYQKADTLGIKFLTGALWPGYDDRPWSRGLGHWIDPQNTSVYQHTWDKAFANQPQWLMIESWNDFNRGSQIQISRTCRDVFIKLTRDKSGVWKGGKPCARMIPDLGLQVPESLIQARKRGLDDSIIEYALDTFFNAQYSQALAILRPTDPLDLLNGGNQLVFFSGSPSHPGQEWSNAVDNDLDGWDGTATVKPAGLQTDPVWAIFGFASQGLYEFDYVTLQTDNGSDDNAVANRQAELVEILVSVTGVKDADFTSVARLKIKQSKMTWYNLGKLVKARYVKLVILQPQYGKGGWRQVVEFGVNSKDKKGAKPVSEETQLAVVPEEFRLEQNYPNPFNPETTIEYTLPEETLVRLAVYDLMGRQVATLVNEPQQPGVHRVIWNAAGIPSGLYLYKITAGGSAQSKRLLIIK